MRRIGSRKTINATKLGSAKIGGLTCNKKCATLNLKTAACSSRMSNAYDVLNKMKAR